MKHLSHRTIAIIVALLSTLSLALAVISLPHQAYAVDGTDGTSGTNSTSQGSDGDSAPIAGGAEHHRHQLHLWRRFRGRRPDFNLDFTFQNMGPGGGDEHGHHRGRRRASPSREARTFYVDALWAVTP